MTAPPPYIRVAHLAPGRGSRDDVMLDTNEVDGMLASDVTVEEKLDGANVVVWVGADGRLESELRSGEGSLDRAGQRGPLRAWIAAHEPAIRHALFGWDAMYGEWLLLTHTVSYDRLPAYLVVLDLWTPTGWAPPGERDRICRSSGLSTPPQVWSGVPGTLAAVEALVDTSAWGDEPMEGLIVRRQSPGEPRLAKLVRAGFDRTGDDEWRAGRPHNRLMAGEASWH
jgi:hypothetical protein